MKFREKMTWLGLGVFDKDLLQNCLTLVQIFLWPSQMEDNNLYSLPNLIDIEVKFS